MKLLLDEDSLGRAFERMLRDAGHDIETVTGIGMAGASDAEVFAYGKRTHRVIVTRNVKDFVSLHKADLTHFAILIEHQDSDPTKNMTYGEIVAAIGKLESTGWNLSGQLIAINAWR